MDFDQLMDELDAEIEREEIRANIDFAELRGEITPQQAAEATAALLERMTHYWRVRTRLPERFGQPCRILARGKMNNQLVEFEDGYKVVTSRNFTRRLK